MALQAALTADTIAGLRRATGKDDDSSESDDTIQRPTNRGGKLKRKADLVHEGQLDRPNGLRVFKRRITHAGYQRTILNRNPKRYDEDGIELEDDEVDQEADIDAARRNPYSHVRIEELLAPLTSAADLPAHPSLSIPYISKILSNMTDQACSMLHRERRALQAVKNLLTRFRGDESYIPCGSLHSAIDSRIFDTDPVYKNVLTAKLHIRTIDNSQASRYTGKVLASGTQGTNRQSTNGSVDGNMPYTFDASANTLNLCQDRTEVEHLRKHSTMQIPTIDSVREGELQGIEHPADAQSDTRTHNMTSREDIVDPGHSITELQVMNDEKLDTVEIAQTSTTQPAATQTVSSAHMESAGNSNTDNHQSHTGALPSPESLKDDVEIIAKDVEDDAMTDRHSERGASANVDMREREVSTEQDIHEPQAPVHRMTTRAQAQAASDNSASSHARSASPTSWVPPTIHPLYAMPNTAQPDRDLGLPVHEAEETRRILVAYVQKQEEVVRGASKLYEGLLRADRMRKTVFKWCKAEGHVGEMSDGEDWYDKEEWGLDEDLRKGHDDEEEDVTTQGKKTRKTRAQ